MSARLVSWKVTGVATPLAVATTPKLPTVAPDVAVMLAKPLASVVAVGDESVADAPLAGAVNVTRTLGTGLPSASATTTTSGNEKSVAGLASAAWGEPLTR